MLIKTMKNKMFDQYKAQSAKCVTWPINIPTNSSGSNLEQVHVQFNQPFDLRTTGPEAPTQTTLE